MVRYCPSSTLSILPNTITYWGMGRRGGSLALRSVLENMSNRHLCDVTEGTGDLSVQRAVALFSFPSRCAMSTAFLDLAEGGKHRDTFMQVGGSGTGGRI